ncbi:Hexokinase, N-terminal [Dillenia turbinata]|uniref:Phosphotransferase n=1 Tax=Dillenia turbinata TaxID=194707 RepID=A0AAN8W016_9MAGN
MRARMGLRSSSVISMAPILAGLKNDCATTLPILHHVADEMTADVRAGLAIDGGSEPKMILSYADSLPAWVCFYALDLGGTNFRVLIVQLGGKDERVIAKEFKQVSIPQELMFGTSEISIDSGIPIKWIKGLCCLWNDVVACVNEAMERRRLDMHVSALANDTVGTLAGARHWDDDVMIAAILGTGTNACYVERVNAIAKLQGHMSTSARTGAISKGLPLTKFDEEQIFEKTISRMYPGEIVRRVLYKMAEAGAWFGDSNSDKLSKPFALGEIRPNCKEDSSNVCDTIVKRGGRLAGGGIVGILQKLEEDSRGLIFGKRTVVAMDGALYEHYPQYRAYLRDAVREFIGVEKSKNLVIEHTKDGSGIGAAFLAATNSKHGHDFWA